MKNLIRKIEKIQEEIERNEISEKKKYFINEMKKVGIERLPYSYSSLKRFIDSETMNFHYNKHYKGYVEKLNLALDKKKFGDLDLEQIVRTISRFNTTIRNNAGGAYNHALFWKMLTPNTQSPKGGLLKKIEKEFGSLSKFKKKFEEEAKDRFGSGWVWLVMTKTNNLKIMSTPNQDNPLMNDVENGGYPILGLDLWEHAYYLKYKNKRDEYIKNFWDVVNWEFVDKLYKMKLETKINEDSVLLQVLDSDRTTLTEITQTPSQKCTPDEEKTFKSMLFPPSDMIKKSPLYLKFKKEYTENWMSLLRKAYPENWKEKDSLFPGHEAGLYTKENIRSLLMNLTSSYAAFCALTKELNNYLSQNNQNKIEFTDNIQSNFVEMRRFFSILDGLRATIFTQGTPSPILNKVGNILKKNDCLGKRTEDAAKQIIEQNLGEGSCKLTAGAGLTTDMISKTDAIIRGLSISEPTNNRGGQLTAQIKPFTNIIRENNYFMIKGSSSAQSYSKVDLLIFVNTKNLEVKIFSTKNIKIQGTNFYIPENNHIIDFKALGKVELMDCNKYLSENVQWL